MRCRSYTNILQYLPIGKLFSYDPFHKQKEKRKEIEKKKEKDPSYKEEKPEKPRKKKFVPLKDFKHKDFHLDG